MSVAWRSRGRATALLSGMAAVYVLAVAVLGTWYQPWYATWPLLLLAALVPARSWGFGLVAGLTAGGLLAPVSVNFFAEMSGRGARNAVVDAATVMLVLVPLTVGCLGGLRTARRGLLSGRALFSRQ